jgi:signal transduction histidine kinase
VLSNLLENAIRHTDDNGQIFFTIEEFNDDHCRLVVNDNGTGIKAEELCYILIHVIVQVMQYRTK